LYTVKVMGWEKSRREFGLRGLTEDGKERKYEKIMGILEK